MTYFVLPNRPESTSYLTERERQIAMERMNRDQTGDVGPVVRRGACVVIARIYYILNGLLRQ